MCGDQRTTSKSWFSPSTVWSRGLTWDRQAWPSHCPLLRCFEDSLGFSFQPGLIFTLYFHSLLECVGLVWIRLPRLPCPVAITRKHWFSLVTEQTSQLSGSGRENSVQFSESPAFALVCRKPILAGNHTPNVSLSTYCGFTKWWLSSRREKVGQHRVWARAGYSFPLC